MIQNLKTLIAVSLKEGKFDAIMNLIKQILSDLHDDKTDENNNYVSTKKGLEEQIANYSVAWNTAEKLRDAAESKAAQLRIDTTALGVAITGLNADIKEVSRLEIAVDNRWSNDQTAYKKRVNEGESVSSALEIIISDLEGLSGTDSSNLIEIQAALKKMKQIGKSNPLLSLVEFTATFDADALADVVAKLKSIKYHTEVSMIDDAADQEAAKTHHAALKFKLAEQAKTFGAELTKKVKLKATKTIAFDKETGIFNDQSASYTAAHASWGAKKACLSTEEIRHTAAIKQM